MSTKTSAFHQHARSVIEPAVIHYWKTLQDVMLSQEIKVIIGGNMRANSPGIYTSVK